MLSTTHTESYTAEQLVRKLRLILFTIKRGQYNIYVEPRTNGSAIHSYRDAAAPWVPNTTEGYGTGDRCTLADCGELLTREQGEARRHLEPVNAFPKRTHLEILRDNLKLRYWCQEKGNATPTVSLPNSSMHSRLARRLVMLKILHRGRRTPNLE